MTSVAPASGTMLASAERASRASAIECGLTTSKLISSHRLNGFEDSCITGAAALIARQCFSKIFGLVWVIQVIQRSQNHSWRTHPALGAAVFLERMKVSVVRQSFNRCDAFSLNLT